MAIKYGVNATNRTASIPVLEGQAEKNSPLKVAYDEFTLTADLALNDQIYMMKLPAGARVHDVKLLSDDLDGTEGTLSVGWLANSVDALDIDGFLTTVDVNPGQVEAMAADQPTRPGFFKQFSPIGGETQVIVAIEVDTAATTGTVKLAVYYALS